MIASACVKGQLFLHCLCCLVLLAVRAQIQPPQSSREECIVSEWQSWSACIGDCNVAWRIRNRHVIVPTLPENGTLMHPCPYLYEVKYCTSEICKQERGQNQTQSLIPLSTTMPTSVTAKVNNSFFQQNQTKKQQLVDDLDSEALAVIKPNATVEQINETINNETPSPLLPIPEVFLPRTVLPPSPLPPTVFTVAAGPPATPSGPPGSPILPLHELERAPIRSQIVELDKSQPNLAELSRTVTNSTNQIAIRLPLNTSNAAVLAEQSRWQTLEKRLEQMEKRLEASIEMMNHSRIVNTSVTRNLTAETNQTSLPVAQLPKPQVEPTKTPTEDQSRLIIDENHFFVPVSAQHRPSAPVFEAQQLSASSETDSFTAPAGVATNREGFTADVNQSRPVIATQRAKIQTSAPLLPVTGLATTVLSKEPNENSSHLSDTSLLLNSTVKPAPVKAHTTTFVPSLFEATLNLRPQQGVPLAIKEIGPTLPTNYSRIQINPELLPTPTVFSPLSRLLLDAVAAYAGGNFVRNTRRRNNYYSENGLDEIEIQNYRSRQLSSVSNATMESSSEVLSDRAVTTSLSETSLRKRCEPLSRQVCSNKDQRVQHVMRWTRPHGQQECLLYGYPFCGSDLEKLENPIQVEEECYAGCFSTVERQTLPVFRRLRFDSYGVRTDTKTRRRLLLK